MFRYYLIGPFLFIALAACQPVVDKGKELKLKLSRGIGGYTGAILPIYSPVQIKIGVVSHWSSKLEILKFLDGTRRSTSASISGQIVEFKSKFHHIWNLDNIHGKSQNSEEPFIKIQFWTQNNGKLTGKPGLTFSDTQTLFGRNEIEFLQQNMLASLKLLPVFKNYLQGDEIISPVEYSRYFRVNWPDFYEDRVQIRLRAVGTTVLLGRPALIGKLSGFIHGFVRGPSTGFKKYSISMSGQGHTVYDIATGLILSSLTNISLEIYRDGKIQNAEAIASWKTITANFAVPPKSQSIP